MLPFLNLTCVALPQRYCWLYNQHIPQKNLGHMTPAEKLKAYYLKNPDLFRKKPINHPGPDK
jgi:hypothetical protein